MHYSLNIMNIIKNWLKRGFFIGGIRKSNTKTVKIGRHCDKSVIEY